MTRFRVRILRQAESELRDAVVWYLARSALAASAFRAEVLHKIDALANDADQWPKNDDGIHARVLSRFPYTLHYDIDGTVVTVLAVAHHRRRPGYWRARTSGGAAGG